jgi:uncharacterized protein YndB with AHSA1/START domain
VIRIAILVLGLLGAVVLAMVAFGYALPVRHVATGETELAAPPDRVFAALVDVEAFPKWRSDVKGVEVVARTPLQWRETGRNDTIAFEAQMIDPPRRLVTRITDKSLPFGGSWTFALQPTGSGTRVAITENGEVYNPLFRVMSRYVFGHTATIERYLTDLQKYLR